MAAAVIAPGGAGAMSSYSGDVAILIIDPQGYQ
jgi:hypothetical protein